MRDRTRDSALPPWYRRQSYTGNLSESEKLELDRLRSLDRHPATQFEDLPEEVQAYIARLEVEAYDSRQQELASYAFAGTAIGLVIILTHHFGIPGLSTLWAWALGVSIVVGSWLIYRHKWNVNAQAFSAADDALAQEWEMKHVSSQRQGI